MTNALWPPIDHPPPLDSIPTILARVAVRTIMIVWVIHPIICTPKNLRSADHISTFFSHTIGIQIQKMTSFVYHSRPVATSIALVYIQCRASPPATLTYFGIDEISRPRRPWPTRLDHGHAAGFWVASHNDQRLILGHCIMPWEWNHVNLIMDAQLEHAFVSSSFDKYGVAMLTDLTFADCNGNQQHCLKRHTATTPMR